MHPFTGLALILPIAMLALRLTDLPALALLLVAVLGFMVGKAGRARCLRQWMGVLLPLALGLLLVHGHWFDNALDSDAQLRSDALTDAARVWLRLATILAATITWLAATPTEKLTRALFASRLPPGAAYLLVSPLLLAEQLKQRLAAIVEAQTARGIDVHASYLRRWRHLAALAGPLVVWMVSDVATRAAALDARAFRSRAWRTTLGAPLKSRRDHQLFAAALFVALLIAASFLWR